MMHETYQLKPLPEKILGEAALSVRQRAEEVDARIEEIIEHSRSEFIECGLLLAEVEDNALWAHLINPKTGDPYNSLPEWADVRLGYGRATYMEAKRVVREFPSIPVETLREIPRVNFKHFRLLPESKREKPEWIEAAKGPEKTFVNKIVNEVPELHVEKKMRLIFTLYESQEKNILMAIDQKMTELKADAADATKEEALEHICREWLEK